MCWNCGVERKIVPESVYSRQPASENAGLKRLSDFKSRSTPRLLTPFASLNKALGGGFAIPSVVQFGGEPGIGKSTLLLQIANGLPDRIVYIANEEDEESIRERADRIGAKNIDRIFIKSAPRASIAKDAILQSGCDLAIIDSLQGFEPEEDGVALTQNITADIALDLCNFAIKKGETEYEHRRGHPVTLVLVSHITKNAELAGLKKISHMVDVVTWFRGDPNFKTRVFRLSKNRKGPSTLAAYFTMEEDGLHEMPPSNGENESDDKAGS